MKKITYLLIAILFGWEASNFRYRKKIIYNISNNKTSLMLTLDENKFIRQTDDARNLKVQFTGNGTGTTTNDLKPNTPYTLASLVTNIAYLFNQRYTKTEVDDCLQVLSRSIDSINSCVITLSGQIASLQNNISKL